MAVHPQQRVLEDLKMRDLVDLKHDVGSLRLKTRPNVFFFLKRVAKLKSLVLSD